MKWICSLLCPTYSISEKMPWALVWTFSFRYHYLWTSPEIWHRILNSIGFRLQLIILYKLIICRVNVGYFFRIIWNLVLLQRVSEWNEVCVDIDEFQRLTKAIDHLTLDKLWQRKSYRPSKKVGQILVIELDVIKRLSHLQCTTTINAKSRESFIGKFFACQDQQKWPFIAKV